MAVEKSEGIAKSIAKRKLKHRSSFSPFRRPFSGTRFRPISEKKKKTKITYGGEPIAVDEFDRHAAPEARAAGVDDALVELVRQRAGARQPLHQKLAPLRVLVLSKQKKRMRKKRKKDHRDVIIPSDLRNVLWNSNELSFVVFRGVSIRFHMYFVVVPFNAE